MSLTGKYILSELGSPGKSGSFFYFSRDYKYIIKTIHHSEHKFLRKILKDYYQHVTDNPNTLLSQFYGLHRVKIPYGKKIHFVIMNNLFPPHRDIHQTFDLKGSTIGRDFTEGDLGGNPRATLKDLNWLRRQRHLELGLEKKRLFLEQLHKDVRLLQKLQIMDYSLLIGIHDLERGNDENLRDKTLQVFNPGGGSSEEYDQSVLIRTPSKLENQRKARELRQMIKSERPVPMGQSSSRMPDELGESHNRPGFIFNQDDGGMRATHEDNSPSEEIYYLGVIDCLTHVSLCPIMCQCSWPRNLFACKQKSFGTNSIFFLSPSSMASSRRSSTSGRAYQTTVRKSQHCLRMNTANDLSTSSLASPSQPKKPFGRLRREIGRMPPPPPRATKEHAKPQPKKLTRADQPRASGSRRIIRPVRLPYSLPATGPRNQTRRSRGLRT